MENENILRHIYEDKFDYKGTEIMKQLFYNNEEFRNIIIEGIKTGKVSGFPKELWDKIEKQNIRRINSFLDVFKEGANLGYCTPASKQLSYSLPDGCLIAGGVVEYLKGTKNSMDGSHTWVVYDGKIYDTTLMLMIDLDFASKLKYKQERIDNPLLDSNYRAAKEFTNDTELSSNKKNVSN